MTFRQEFRRPSHLEVPTDSLTGVAAFPISFYPVESCLEPLTPGERAAESPRLLRRLRRALAPVVAPMAEWRPFGGKGTTLLNHEVVCLHTIVGNLSGAWSWASQPGNPYFHFGVGGYGETWQGQDLRYRAAANLEGNDRCISIETADRGAPFPYWDPNGSDVPAWTAAQLDAIIELVVWLCRTYNIPPVLVHDSCPGTRGIAYHRLGIDPYRVGSCERWSSARGKVCPGDRRAAQTVNIIIPAVKRILGGIVTPPEPEDWLAMATEAEVRAIVREENAAQTRTLKADYRAVIVDHSRRIRAWVTTEANRVIAYLVAVIKSVAPNVPAAVDPRSLVSRWRTDEASDLDVDDNKEETPDA